MSQETPKDIAERIANANWRYGGIVPLREEIAAAIQAERDQITRLEGYLERAGWRRCDIAACNCNGWHNWNPSRQEIEVEVSEKLLAKWSGDMRSCGEISCDDCNDRTAALRERAQKAEAEVERLKRLPELTIVRIPDAVKREWVHCPVCDEPDMRKETDKDGNSLIYCVNHNCASNGGTQNHRLEEADEFIINAPHPEVMAGSHLTIQSRGQLAFALIDNLKRKALERRNQSQPAKEATKYRNREGTRIL
jgi:hypothetical protein